MDFLEYNAQNALAEILVLQQRGAICHDFGIC